MLLLRIGPGGEAQHRCCRPAVRPLVRVPRSYPGSKNEAVDIPGVGLSDATNYYAPAVVKRFNVVSPGGGGGGGGRRGDKSQDGGKVNPAKWDGRVMPYKVGDVVEGVVQSIKPYGAFVNLGGFIALLHLTQVSHTRVKSVESILKKGDKLKALILSCDWDKSRVTLSTKKLEPIPGDMLRDPQLVYDKAEEMAEVFKSRGSVAATQDTGKVKPVKWDGRVLPFKVYDVVEGVVQSVQPYGTFVDLGGFVGLLHITQISHNRVEDVQSILKEGDKLKVMVLSHESDRGRVNLSTRKLEPTPGDMLRDPKLVYDKAEEMAEKFRIRVLAVTQEVLDSYIPLSSQDAGYVMSDLGGHEPC